MFSTRTRRVQTIPWVQLPTDRHNGAMLSTSGHRWSAAVRAALNAINLTTVVGLLIAVAGRSRVRRGGNGMVLAEHYRLGIPRRGAFTIGNVVLFPGGSLDDLAQRYPDILDHEAAHAWQYAACIGLPFFPLYAIASGWSWLRTGDAASANFFERAAGLSRGGYVEQPRNNAGWKRLTGTAGKRRA